MSMTTEIVDKNGKHYLRPSRQKETEARARTFVAAREALADIGNATELAAKHNISRGNVTRISLILRFGTPEEIAAVETNAEPVSKTWLKIRDRVPKEAFANRKSKPGKEVVQAKRSNVRIFKQLKIAFDALSGMPNPQDVIAICKGHRMRSATVERQLLTVHTWLEDFSDAWTK